MGYQKLQANRAAVVTSDTANIPNISDPTIPNNGCVIFVGVGGDLRVSTTGGDDVVFKNVPTGSFVPVQVVKVFATNTTATDIVALW